MNDFIFTGQSYLAPNGDAVNFAFSSNRQGGAQTSLAINVIQSVKYEYTVAVVTQISLSSVAVGAWPLQLTFDEPWPALTSPISLLFDTATGGGDNGGGTTDPVPQVLGIAVGISWTTIKAIQQQLAMTDYAAKVDERIESRWQGDAVAKHNVIAWASKNAVEQHITQPWIFKLAVGSRSAMRWSLPASHRNNAQFDWATGDARQTKIVQPWHAEPAVNHRPTQRFTVGDRQYQQTPVAWHGESVVADKYVKWGFPTPHWICTDAYQPPEPGLLVLRFNEPWKSTQSPLQLRFDANETVCHLDNGGGYIPGSPTLPPLDFKIPISPQMRRLYLMQPMLTCHRVSDERELVIKSVSISDARSQFVSTASIEFSSKGDAALAKNQLLRININGYDFHIISEQPNKREAWNSGSYSSSGRGKAAELLTPWRSAVSYSNSGARTFGGVLSDLLQNTGWTVALQGITDFTIPDGVATISDKTPLESMNEFAGMVGCMLSPDNANNFINVYPLWPTVPWEMASTTADVNIHDAVIIDYSSNETISQQCNAAWVRGEQQGVDAKVTLTGTAGNIATADISNALIVDVIAARLAGTNAIAETGNGEDIQVSLPVMADLPPLKKGQLIGVTWRTEVYKALCDNVTISASVDDNGAVTVQQQAKLLRKLN